MRAFTIRAGLLFLLSLHAYPFNFTSDFNAGIYWSGFPIVAQKFAASQSEGQLLNSLVAQAENAWEDNVGREIWNIPSTFELGSPTGNTIRWSNSFAAETGFNPSTTLAVTVRYRVGTHFSKFEIILNGENQALRNNVSNILYQTILHELGHVIGLDHSEFSNAIMYASLQGVSNLSNDDVNGANAVIDENLRRQSIGFVSELAREPESSSNALACGSIVDVSNSNPPSGGFLTITVGFFFTLLAFRTRKKFPHRV